MNFLLKISVIIALAFIGILAMFPLNHALTLVNYIGLWCITLIGYLLKEWELTK